MDIKSAVVGAVSLFALNSYISAQVSSGGFPIEETDVCALKSSKAMPVITMPEFDLATDTVPVTKSCAKKFAHKFNTDINIKEEGHKTSTSEYNIWRLGIKSEDATSLNLIFKNLQIPKGARLFIFTPNMEQKIGAFTSSNNTPFDFATSPLDGDEVVVQYEEPKDAESASVEIKSVNHGFLKLAPQFQTSEDCEMEAAWDTVHLDQRQSCVQLIINGEILCSGNMINNTRGDGTPYIITAGHCFLADNSDNTIDTTKTHSTVVFFNHEAPSASWIISGNLQTSVSGATTAAYRKNRDMMLIKLNSLPPVDYRPFYAGWNRESSITGPVYAFHHPQGDNKKISTDEATPSASSNTFDNMFLKDGHWRVYRWDDGITEGGSSGCGLFDSNGLIVGNLSGGSTKISCTVRGEDYFWRLNAAWDDATAQINNLSAKLDPDTTGATRVNGLQPYANPCRRITNRKADDLPSEGSNSNGFPVGINNAGIDEFAEKFTSNDSCTIYGVYFYPESGVYNSKQPVKLRIYSGDSVPDSMLCNETLMVQVTQYVEEFNNFSIGTLKKWEGMENYFRLSKPVSVSGNFFVAFNIASAASKDSFALYHTEARTDSTENTAYFHDKTGWKPYTQHPTDASAMSIMTDVVLRDGWFNADTMQVQIPDMEYNETKKNSSSGTKTTGDFVLYPSPTDGTIYLKAPEEETLKTVKIWDAYGHIRLIKDGIDAESPYEIDLNPYCNEGVYYVKATYKFETKYYRLVKFDK